VCLPRVLIPLFSRPQARLAAVVGAYNVLNVREQQQRFLSEVPAPSLPALLYVGLTWPTLLVAIEPLVTPKGDKLTSSDDELFSNHSRYIYNTKNSQKGARCDLKKPR